MPNNNEQQYQPLTFDAIKIGLASPEKIMEWSRGEVTKPETINYRTLKPEKDGLFCERIFGPSKDWECHCGKYKKIRYKGVVCDRCGVEVTKSSVRRERMGHIALAAPVSHIWYFKGIPSRMGLILDISPRTLERVLYFASYIVLDKGETDLQNKQILSEAEYQEQKEKWGSGAFRVGMGAEAVKELLEAIDLDKEYDELQGALENATGQKRARIVKRLEVVEAFRESGNRPEWMILTAIPVIPPDLLETVWCAANRVTRSGRLLGAEERVDARTALEAVTANAAFQYFEERDKGTLSPGKRADLVILDRDPLAVPPEELRVIRVLETWKDGAAIFRREP